MTGDATPEQPTRQSKAKAQSVNPAFRYLGIPASWLSRQKIKLPSRNTSAFLLGSGSLVALYLYDRHQCKKIKQQYIDQVRHLSEALVPSSHDPSFHSVAWMPRKVNVYGARIPEDVDVDRGTQWFKRYVKPILVAGAIDYTIHNGTTPGALARKISDDIRDQRVLLAAQLKNRSSNDSQSALIPGMPGYREWHAEQHKLEGGSLILGRTTWKEYLWGLKDGYKRKIPIDELDDDERFSKQLEEAGIFDTPSSSADEAQESSEQFGSSSEMISEDDQLQSHPEHISSSSVPGLGLAGTSDKATSSRILNFFSKSAPPSYFSSGESNLEGTTTNKILEPSMIPPQPPVLLIPFDYPIGIRWWPLKVYRFFNQRSQVELGAKTAMLLIDSHTRPMEPPMNQEIGIFRDDQDSLNGGSFDCFKINNLQDLKVDDDEIRLTGSKDLDFLCPDADLHLRRSYQKAAQKIIEERNMYRNEVKNRLKTARDVQENGDDQSLNEQNNSQLNESQIRLEAFQKEKKWNDLLKAWFIVRKGSGISWHSDMAMALKIFHHPPSSQDDDSHQSSEFQ